MKKKIFESPESTQFCVLVKHEAWNMRISIKIFHITWSLELFIFGVVSLLYLLHIYIYIYIYI